MHKLSLNPKVQMTNFTSAKFQKMFRPTYIILKIKRIESKQCGSAEAFQENMVGNTETRNWLARFYGVCSFNVSLYCSRSGATAWTEQYVFRLIPNELGDLNR